MAGAGAEVGVLLFHSLLEVATATATMLVQLGYYMNNALTVIHTTAIGSTSTLCTALSPE